MKLQIPTGRQPRKKAAYTIVEFMIASFIGMAIVGVIATVSINSAFSYAAMGNYVAMADQSRNAMDVIGREVRDSSTLIAFSTNNPVYLELTNSTSSSIVTIGYDSTNNILFMSKTGQTYLTLLKGCNSWSFSLYNRFPLFTSNSISFCVSTNINGQLDPSVTKVINMTWKCSRKILGTKIESQSVQTAQVILRNKTQ